MARKFASNIDLQKNQLLNAIVQILSAAPGSPSEGQIYYDSTLHQFGYYNGSSWTYGTTPADASTSVKGVIQLANDLAGTATSPTVVGLHLAADTAINHKLTSVTDPTAAQDAATKNYVDNKLNGIAWKQAVAAATAAALPAYTQSGSGATGTLTATANGALTVDGYAVQVGDRILVLQSGAIGPGNTALAGAAAAKDAGIYTVSATGGAGAPYVLVRASDATTQAQIQDATVLVQQGTVSGDAVYNLTNTGAVTVDTTAQAWAIIQSGTSVTGDSIFTTRSGNQIKLLGSSAVPSTPANGAVTNPSNATSGGTRKVTGALAGDGATTSFTITHNLATSAIQVIAQQNNSGVPGAPVELDWAPGTNNTVVITFPTAPTAGLVYYVTVFG